MLLHALDSIVSLLTTEVQSCLKQRVFGRLLVSAIISIAVGACATHGQRQEREQKYPDNYKTELLDFLRTYINDPTNIRDAAVTDPVVMPLDSLVSSSGADTSNTSSSNSSDSAGGRRGGWGGRRGNSLTDSGSNPFGGRKRERYVVCVRYNAKDREGHYTGVKNGAAIYADGRFDGFREQLKSACSQENFKPFPELESMHR